MVSVIIPTHNRRMCLRLTLDALARQTYSADLFEVVVILDGCIDGSLEMLQNYSAPYNLQFIAQEQKGASTARNQGGGIAKGELLIFLDDDVEATSDLVLAHVNLHNKSGHRVVIGYYPPALAGNKSLLSLELQCWWEEIFHDMQETGHRFCYKDMLSGNFSILREIYARVGGFDPALPMREDYELGMRLIQADVDFTFEPQALGLHHDQAILSKATHRKFVEGIADVRVGRKHPELIPTLLIWSLLNYAKLPSRLLQQLAYRSPHLANWIASKAAQMLPGLEKARLVGLWRRVLYGVLAYWYWKGVIQELPTRKALQEFAVDLASTIKSDNKPEVIIDISLGLDQAEETLDHERPDSVEIIFGDHFIGRLPYQPGAERWRGKHLRPYLIRHFLFKLLKTFTIQGLISFSVDTKEIRAFHQNDILL
jgi:glycosyltransferase involved in cell wall biosynthesis